MNEREFKDRTKRLALQAIQLAEDLPRSRTGDVLGRQLLRSATSVGANYRAACRGKSTADVINKLGTVEEEADETLYWLELISESHLTRPDLPKGLMSDVNEVLAMTVASIKTLRLKSVQMDGKSKIQNPKSKIR